MCIVVKGPGGKKYPKLNDHKRLQAKPTKTRSKHKKTTNQTKVILFLHLSSTIKIDDKSKN